ncbi:autoinducer-2 kinase [Paenibacillus albiflavus]|uniref:Autoinducer-2 kinase n=1 Tax=Paenibacillus albiflavus TaxID=2545760 RepID=A0A4V2WMI9_9BACL|nr:autoinducer-2 kinase [Paenibacillus albiflavus]TCZ69939.1 autoinducer-2 kinase [Paenibacillus albiflavus]
MTEKLLMALDGGTGSFRAVIYNTLGEQIAINQKEWHHKPDPAYPGSIDFDFHKNWTIIVQCIKDLLKDNPINADNIIGISTTSMREGIVLYDKDHQELMAFSNVDARSTAESIYLKEQFPTLEKELYKTTGQTFALSSIPRLLWVKNHKPEIYQATTYINMLNDWIIFKLTGKLTSEPSNACTTGLFSLEKRTWDSSLADICGIKSHIFPQVYESGTVIGQVTSQVAIETGLSNKSLVVAGGGDAQLGCLGVGNVNNAQATLFGGSFWQYEFNSNQVSTDPKTRIRVNCHAVPNLWQFEAIAWNAGLIMRWFRDAFCQEEKKQALENNVTVYSILDHYAEQIPAGSNGIIPTFADLMNFGNLKNSAPSFTNFDIDPERFNKYTFYRSIMENAGLISYGHMKLVAGLTGILPKEVIFAGGSSYSPLWCQIISDILGVKVKTPKEKEATALGAAMLAGVGTGVYTSLEEATQIIKFDTTYYPNQENHKKYMEIYKSWQKVYKAQLKLSDQGFTKHMWIAPGAK